MKTLKELWLEGNKKEASSAIVNQYFDVILDGDTATFLVSKQTQNVASPKNEENLEKNKVQNNIFRICISDKATENLIVKAAEFGASYLIISCANWRVIPLENLLARIKGKSKLIAIEARTIAGASNHATKNHQFRLNEIPNGSFSGSL